MYTKHQRSYTISNPGELRRHASLPVPSLPLLLLLLLCLSTSPAHGLSNNSDTRLALNRFAACKLPRSPLLCQSKLLRYTYDSATGNCVSLYTSGCGTTAMTKHFLTFEECRRDRMQILRY